MAVHQLVSRGPWEPLLLAPDPPIRILIWVAVAALLGTGLPMAFLALWSELFYTDLIGQGWGLELTVALLFGVLAFAYLAAVRNIYVARVYESAQREALPR